MALKSVLIISLTLILLVSASNRDGHGGGRHGRRSNLSQNTRRAFTNAKIVPDILEKAPKSILNVQYGDKKIRLGGRVDTPTYLDAPTVQWPTREGQLYTLFMLDPDTLCPALPNGRNTLHWLVSNIKGNDLSGNGAKTNAVYIPPWSGPDRHRFVFLVFEQPGPVTYEDYVGFEAIAKFDLKAFIQRHGLPTLPRFGNFYTTFNASEPRFEVDCNVITVPPTTLAPVEATTLAPVEATTLAPVEDNIVIL